MKINPSYGLEQYKSLSKIRRQDNSFASKLNLKAKESSESTNTDKVSFSANASAKANLAKLNSAQSRDVENKGNTERLALLKEKIENGNYYVASDILADNILSKLG